MEDGEERGVDVLAELPELGADAVRPVLGVRGRRAAREFGDPVGVGEGRVEVRVVVRVRVLVFVDVGLDV